MIRLAESGAELDFLPADPYAARITALFDTYGAGYDFALFWVQTDDAGNSTAAICRVDGNAALTASENADIAELKAFLGAVGFSTLICDEKLAQALDYRISDSSFTVEYVSPVKSDFSGSDAEFDKKQVYDLLVSCGFSMGDYRSFLADICARLNKGTASAAVIEKNGDAAACAFALFRGRKSTLLGAVATRESERGRGYAGSLVRHLANDEKKKVFLFCRNDSLVEFYKKNGFEIAGRWAVIKE